MTPYWCKLFEPGGRVAGAEKMLCLNDADAIAKAQTIYATYHAYEIWDGMRLVHRVERQTTI